MFERSDLRYVAAYLLPLSAYIAVTLGGLWSFLTTAIAFIAIPTLELAIPVQRRNHRAEVEEARAANPAFDWLLYLNLPLVYGLIIYWLYRFSHTDFAWWEVVGICSSVGVVMGANGINVAHELGHRVTWIERTMSKMLLLPSIYLQFHIDHNRGHHKHVGTPDDPATARYGETIYWFWLRVITQVFFSAWRIERTRLQKQGHSQWSLRNGLLRYVVYESCYLGAVCWLAGWQGLLVALAIALQSVLLLESIDYIEHYGLTRQEIAPGKYERVQPKHSWNSNHLLGRAFLYELTRHSDHHAVASRQYQILRHHEPSPELPFGYPASMLLAMIPPLWFRTVHPRLSGA